MTELSTSGGYWHRGHNRDRYCALLIAFAASAFGYKRSGCFAKRRTTQRFLLSLPSGHPYGLVLLDSRDYLQFPVSTIIGWDLRRRGRVAEGGALLKRCTPKGYRRFESYRLRHQYVQGIDFKCVFRDFISRNPQFTPHKLDVGSTILAHLPRMALAELGCWLTSMQRSTDCIRVFLKLMPLCNPENDGDGWLPAAQTCLRGAFRL